MRPARLPGKLIQIRDAFKDTQEGMARRLGFLQITREYISGYELGTREPPLPVLLRLAEIAGVYVDVLIDDELDLPKEIPSVPKSIGIRRTHKMKVKYKQ
jgi:transcriptional regulator with XRE-family HTH domain